MLRNCFILCWIHFKPESTENFFYKDDGSNSLLSTIVNFMKVLYAVQVLKIYQINQKSTPKKSNLTFYKYCFKKKCLHLFGSLINWTLHYCYRERNNSTTDFNPNWNITILWWFWIINTGICIFFISSSFDLPNLKKSQKLKTVFFIFAMYMDNFIVTWVGVVDYHSNYISVNH